MTNEFVNRRTFIKAGITFIAALLPGMILLDFRHVCREMILSDISQLRIEKTAVDKFLKEAKAEGFFLKFGFKKRIFTVVQHLLHPLNIRLPHYNKYRLIRNQITGQFLLSTDLFLNSNINRKIKYLGFHNPYKRICSNPFASLWSGDV